MAQTCDSVTAIIATVKKKAQHVYKKHFNSNLIFGSLIKSVYNYRIIK